MDHRIKTARAAGAVGARAIVPRVAREIAKAEGLTVLDFGCGPKFHHRDAYTADGIRAHGYDLSFGDGTFDIVHAHQVLQHVDDPVAALREMRRVCRPGGIVAARDADYGAMTWHPADDRLDRWLETYRSVAVANGGQPEAGPARASRGDQVHPSRGWPEARARQDKARLTRTAEILRKNKYQIILLIKVFPC